jgi:hypothetical protein
MAEPPDESPARENLSHRTEFCLYEGYMRTIERAIGNA